MAFTRRFRAFLLTTVAHKAMVIGIIGTDPCRFIVNSAVPHAA